MGRHVESASQVRRPWHAVGRTVFQGVVGFAPLVPAIVDAAGIDETAPLVAAGVAISAGITRVMALPQVEAWLRRFVPFLAADPGAK